MSEDLLDTEQFGKASVEAGQGYTAMPDPAKIEEAQAEQQNFNRIVNDMNVAPEPGSAAGEPLPLHYHEPGDPNKTIDPKLTLEPEHAARDLANWRRGMEDTQRALRDQQLAAEVEALRTAEAGQPQPQPQPQQQQPAEPPPQLEGVPQEENDWLVKQFQAEPRLLETFRAYQYQTEQQVAQAQAQAAQHAEATQRQYVDALASYATAASATIFQAFPELNGLSADQMPAVIQAIGKQNPERAMQMSNHIQNVQLLSAKAQQAQAAQAQQYQAAQQRQFQNWSRAEDDAYSEATKTDTPQRTAAIKDEVMGMLRRSGLSDQQIAWEYNNNALMRSRAGQMILRAAALYSMQQRTADTVRRAPAPAPKVQVPGPTGQRATEEDSDLRSLSQRLNQSHSAKDAAMLLAARRARSR